ncbi:DoxX family protein [Qipengyuania sp. 1NDH17]|uniref:DoxX family protein n=1 Tax=Qipengyuania polymorpha TaxID=2867234 RepID=A0ABS7IY01_9SPHN|nr:DoxX family protein [Qipengyuania polymorpha]MBX7457061.1 DoxX family protein [Qipengyuania polymorpha]
MNTAATTIAPTSEGTPGTSWLALAARLMLAAIFLLAGLNKITDPASTIGYIASVGLPAPTLAYWGAVAIEVLGALTLIAGFKTRMTALALAAFSLVTAFVFHNQIGDQTQFVMFFKNIAIAGGLLQLAAFGPGTISLDRK